MFPADDCRRTAGGPEVFRSTAGCLAPREEFVFQYPWWLLPVKQGASLKMEASSLEQFRANLGNSFGMSDGS
eukprot:s1605_g12.t1